MALLKTNTGIGTTNPSSALHVIGDELVTGVVTATTFIGALTGIAASATQLVTPRTFEITGDVVASPIFFDGTGNVSLAATIQPNSVGLGTDTTGDYVRDITGTSNQITVTGGTGEGSTPTLSIPNQFVVPQDIEVARDLQVNRNLNVNGNITIGGTSATLFSQSLNIFDPDIVLGFRTDAFGNDVSNDNTANHGGVAVASTEGTPLVQLFIAGIETNPATYKKIMWFKAGEFAGLGTDAWLFNYAVGIGSTQFPTGTRLAAGDVQFTERDLAVVRNINASGIITTLNLSVTTFDATNANILTGIITTLSGTNLNYTGIGTVLTLNSTNSSLTNINSSGISTLGVTSVTRLTAQSINSSGIVTGSTFRPSTGYIQAADGTNAFYIYNTNGNVAFQGTIGASKINNASGYNAIDFGTTVNPNVIIPNNLNVLGFITTGNQFISTNTSLLPPTPGNYSGERLRLYDFNNNAQTNYAIGVEGSHIWFGVDTNLDAQGFKWYGDTTQVMRLSAAGNLSVSGIITANNISISGNSTFASNGGITTTGGDLYVGGDFYVKDDLVVDEINARNINISGISTIATLDGNIADFNTLSVNVGIITTLGITTANTENAYIQNSYVNTGIVTTLSGTNLNYVGVGTIASLNATSSAVTNYSGTNLNISGIATIGNVQINTLTNSRKITSINGEPLTIESSSGTIFLDSAVTITGTTNSGTINATGNLNVTGVATATTFNGQVNSGIGTITTLSGTTATYTTGNFTTSNINTGIITTLSGTNLKYNGIGTITTLSGTTANLINANITTGIVTTISGTNLNYSGIGTISTLDGNIANFNTLSANTGIVTTIGITTANIENAYLQNSYVNTGIVTTLSGTNLSYSGIGTIGTLDTTTGTIDYLSGTNISYSGIGTIESLDTSIATIDNLSSTNVSVSGIVTASQFHTGPQGSSIRVTSNSITGPSTIIIDPSGIGDDTGVVRIKGDLFVDGSQTVINSTTIELADFNVGIATTIGTNLLLDGAGIGIGSTNIRKTFTYDYSSDSLKSSENVDLASGKVYKINETEVLSSTQLTVANISSSGIGTIETLDSTTGTIDYLNGTNVNYSGVGTIATLNATTGSITNLSGTSLAYANANIVTGVITSISGTNLNYIGVGTIATLNSTTGNITTLNSTNANVVTGIVTDLSGTNLNYTGVGTIATLNSTTSNLTTANITNANIVTGIVTTLSGTNLNYTGIGTISTLNSTTGSIATLSGTNLAYTNGNIVTGIITDLSGTNLNYTGVGTIATLDNTTANITTANIVTGIVTNLSGTNLNYTGVGTINTLDTTNGTVDYLSGTNVSYSGIGTIETLDTTNGTIDFLSNTNLNTSGVGTIATLNSTNGTITNLSGTIGTITTLNSTTASIASLNGTNINYSGIGTVSTLNSTNGTVSSLSGTNISYTNANIITGIITNISGTNLNYSGVGTISTLNNTNLNVSGVGTISTLSGTNITYTSGTISTLDVSTGNFNNIGGTGLNYGNGSINTLNVINGNTDYLTGTNLNFSGIGTIATFNSTNSNITNLTGTAVTITSLTGTAATITNLNGTSISYTTGNFDTANIIAGVVTTLSGTTVNYSNANINTGIVTTLIGTNLNYTGVGTIGTLDNTNLNVSGVGTFVNLKIGTGVTISNGIVSATTFYGNFDGELNALGKTYYVATTGNNSNTGTNINQPFLTIAQALSVATNGDVINISAGTYEEIAPLTVPRGVTLKGSGLRATTIKPTDGTKTNNIFLLNDISTIEDFTITGSYYNSTSDTGYAFAYAPGIAITTRSPYIQRITVLNKGSVTSFTDPYGYNTADSPPTSYIAGRGAKVDGSLVAGHSLEAGMLFNEVTFFTPNNTGIILTNGARAEYLNCFHYFSSQAIVGVAGSVGIGSTANARIKVSGLSTSLVVNNVIKQFNGFGTAVAIGTVRSYDAPYVTITGKGSGIFTSVGIGTTQDIRVFQSDGTTQIGFASALSFVDYKMFGAEMRSVGCAVEYGAEGVIGDGVGVQLRMFATNFNHVGSGKDFTNDDTLVIQANEVIELNGGQVSYVSIDQAGDFRVGDALYINQETGTVSFAATSYDLSVLGNLTITDGVSNTTTITPTSLTVGNLQLSANTFSSTSGDINIDPGGSSETNVIGNLNVSGILTASVLQASSLQLGDTSVAIDDTGSDGTIRLNTDGLEAMRVTNSQRVAIGTNTASSKLDILGDVKIVGILTATTFKGQINSGIGTITTLDVTTANLGIINATTANIVSGIITTLSGSTVTYTNGNFTNANIVTGIITNISGTNLNYSGIGSFADLRIGTGVTVNSGVVTAIKLSTGDSGIGINIDSNIITGPSTIIIDPAGVGDNTGAVRIKGDLFVDGTQTIINSTTIELADFNVGVATDVTDNSILDGAGIGIGATNIRKTLTYDHFSSSIKSSENFNLAFGKNYNIDGTNVLSATSLGGNVVDSSLTSVGTLNQLNVSGTISGVGTINSSTDVQIDGVSVLTTASADAVALAIALG